eukprot:3033001-Rhodomonas_salina.1
MQAIANLVSRHMCQPPPPNPTTSTARTTPNSVPRAWCATHSVRQLIQELLRTTSSVLGGSLALKEVPAHTCPCRELTRERARKKGLQFFMFDIDLAQAPPDARPGSHTFVSATVCAFFRVASRAAPHRSLVPVRGGQAPTCDDPEQVRKQIQETVFLVQIALKGGDAVLDFGR